MAGIRTNEIGRRASACIISRLHIERVDQLFLQRQQQRNILIETVFVDKAHWHGFNNGNVHAFIMCPIYKRGNFRLIVIL